MSHYSKIKTKISNRDFLVKALNDLGFTKEMIKVSDIPMQLEGYQGDKRADTAEIVIPRRFVGGSSNDLGFKLQEDGTWGAIISDFDKSSGQSHKNDRTAGMRGYGENWLNALTQRYNYQHIKQQVADNGYYITEEREENGEVFMEIQSSY